MGEKVSHRGKSEISSRVGLRNLVGLGLEDSTEELRVREPGLKEVSEE